MTLLKQVCVQLPTYADNLALPAFARRTPLLQQTCSSGSAAVQGPCWDGQRDGRTPRRLIDLTPHTMRVMLCSSASIADVKSWMSHDGLGVSCNVASRRSYELLLDP